MGDRPYGIDPKRLSEYAKEIKEVVAKGIEIAIVIGCGRLFEGDAGQMMRSLEKLNQLPSDTKVYCGHEYTIRNLEFAETLEPRSKAIQDKLVWSRARRREGQPTVPTTLASERETNPFLRTGSPELRATLERLFPDTEDQDETRFAQARLLKDEF